MNFSQFLLESESKDLDDLYAVVMKEVSLIDPKDPRNVEERTEMLFNHDTILKKEYAKFISDIGAELELKTDSKESDIEKLKEIKISNNLKFFLFKLK